MKLQDSVDLFFEKGETKTTPPASFSRADAVKNLKGFLLWFHTTVYGCAFAPLYLLTVCSWFTPCRVELFLFYFFKVREVDFTHFLVPNTRSESRGSVSTVGRRRHLRQWGAGGRT